MVRLCLMLGSFLVMIAAATVFAVFEDREASIRVGSNTHHLRTLTKKPSGIERATDSLLVWMGDSTMVSKFGNPAYGVRVSQALGPRVETLFRIRPGINFYHFYLFMADVLAVKPDVIVANVTLRLMDPSRGHPLQGLASEISITELPRALKLPFYETGLTLPHLLLLRLLRFPEVEQAYYFLTGVRQRFHDASFWPAGRGRLAAMRASPRVGMESQNFVAYDDEIARNAPMLRMIEATVDLAIRNGARMLIVVSPIPWHRLQKFELYDRERAERRIRILREAVEAAGGQLLDLHALLDEEEFKDFLGHATSAGNRKITQKLLPRVRNLLERAHVEESVQ